MDGCITILGDNNFSIYPIFGFKFTHSSNRYLEYSLDGSTWTKWSSYSSTVPTITTTNKVIYLRGTGITRWTQGASSSGATIFSISGANVSIFGNVWTLLDYNTVLNGDIPVHEENALALLFYGCAAIVDISGMVFTYSSETNMEYEWFHMFDGCSNLRTLPQFIVYTYSNSDRAPATYMFDECPLLKISKVQTDIYKYPYSVTNLSGSNYRFYYIFKDNVDYGISDDPNYALYWNTQYYVAWQPSELNTCTVSYNGEVISSFTTPFQSIDVQYNNSTITTLTKGITKILECNHKIMNSNVTIGTVTLDCNGKIMLDDVTITFNS